VHGILRVKCSRIAVKKAFAKMHQHSLSFLRLTRECKLLQELPKCLVECHFFELEVAKIFVSDDATKFVAVKKMENSSKLD
jgi:hypothetical protein